MSGLVKTLFGLHRNKDPKPSYIEPSPPPSGEYPANTFPELTPYPYFIPGQPVPDQVLNADPSSFPPQQFPPSSDPQQAQQVPHPQGSAEGPHGTQQFDYIPEVTEPTDTENLTYKRGYELGTRPPPVPPKSPFTSYEQRPELVIPEAVPGKLDTPFEETHRQEVLDESSPRRQQYPWPRPPPSQFTDNSAAQLERYLDIIQRSAAKKVEPWRDNHEPFVGQSEAASPPPPGEHSSRHKSKHQPTMSFSAAMTGQHQPASSAEHNSILSRGARHSHCSGSGGVCGEEEEWEPQPLTAENLSMLSQQSAKSPTFQPPAKREKAKTPPKVHKKSSHKAAVRSSKDTRKKSSRDKGKGHEVNGLFDSQFDILGALEHVDRYRSRGFEEDNVAHMQTLAMLSAATGGALNEPLSQSHKHERSSREGNGGVSTVVMEGNTSGELNTSGEVKQTLHQSFNTTTTESFGHIYHRDGRPVPPPMNGPSQRFSHQKNNSGGGLADISEATESKVEVKDRRSATVEDAPDVDARPRTHATSSTSVLKHETPAAAPAPGAASGAEESESSPSSSDAATDFKKVQGLVDRSCFHDEVLCQLLDAIHNRLIGEEAQKALIRAAKARVIELKARQARGEDIMLSPPRVSTKPLKIKKKRASKPATEPAKTSLEPPPPMTREPSSGHEVRSALHTPTEETSSNSQTSQDRAEARASTPQDWAKKIQSDLQHSLKLLGLRRTPKGKEKVKRKHKSALSVDSSLPSVPSTALPSLHGTPFTTGPNPTPMHRDPTPTRESFPANISKVAAPNSPHDPLPLGLEPAFGQPHGTSGRGHAATASWSGPVGGSHPTPVPIHPHQESGPTYTSAEMARAAEGSGGGPVNGPRPGLGRSDTLHSSGDPFEKVLQTMFRTERYSLPVSDEELRSAADFINGARVPLVVPLGMDYHPPEFDYPSPQPNMRPWSRSASIHTLDDETRASFTPPPGAKPPPSLGAHRAASEASRAPTVPPKEASPTTAHDRTPRMTDIHLPTCAIAPTITLQPPTTAEPTTTSTPVGSHPRTESGSTQDRSQWDATVQRRDDDFDTAQCEQQLPVYQSQPTSPSKVVLPESDARGYFPETPVVAKQKLSSTHTASPREKEKLDERPYQPSRTEPSLAAASPQMTHKLPENVPRGVDSMRSPETMTTTFTLSGRRELKPPDFVTERLYAWAGEKTEQEFVETLERLSGGEEIREFPLTVFTLQTWKRYMKAKLDRAPGECERLLLSPEVCDAINRAVQARDYNDAANWLLQAWAPFGREKAPTHIVSLHRHGVQDAWFANRYDIPRRRMLSYHVSASTIEVGSVDRRPHLWWNAISAAWPDLMLPDAERQSVAYRVTSTPVLERRREDASTRAAIIARNLLLSYDPLFEYDLQKLRELITAEVSRLLERKRRGKLRVGTRSSKTSS